MTQLPQGFTPAEIDLTDAARRKALAAVVSDAAWAAGQRSMQDETVEILLRYGLVASSDEALSRMVGAIRHEDDAALDSIIASELMPKDGLANDVSIGAMVFLDQLSQQPHIEGAVLANATVEVVAPKPAPVVDLKAEEERITAHFQRRIQDGDLPAEDFARLLARYGLLGSDEFVAEMDERIQMATDDAARDGPAP